MLHNWSRYTRENSPSELSILLCISEARENFAEQAKLGRWRAANRAAVADRRREAGNRRASGSGGTFTFDPRRAFFVGRMPTDSADKDSFGRIRPDRKSLLS